MITTHVLLALRASCKATGFFLFGIFTLACQTSAAYDSYDGGFVAEKGLQRVILVGVFHAPISGGQTIAQNIVCNAEHIWMENSSSNLGLWRQAIRKAASIQPSYADTAGKKSFDALNKTLKQLGNFELEPNAALLHPAFAYFVLNSLSPFRIQETEVSSFPANIEAEIARLGASANSRLKLLVLREGEKDLNAVAAVLSSAAWARFMPDYVRGFDDASLRSDIEEVIVKEHVLVRSGQYEKLHLPAVESRLSSTFFQHRFELIQASNRYWFEKISNDQARRIAVVVGGAHLPGKNGLLEMFRSSGYRIGPIKIATKTKAC